MVTGGANGIGRAIALKLADQGAAVMIADINKDKHNKFTPGSLIKIIDEKKIRKMKPDYMIVLPWHFKSFIIQKEKKFLNEGGKLIFPLPDIEIV